MVIFITYLFMRLWTLHPTYLDSKGLVALWREALLAQKVLKGETKGYRQHPQLERFKQVAHPVSAIATYLVTVHQEATRRGYQFDASKIASGRVTHTIPVTTGQVFYEFTHLKAKLKVRDKAIFDQLQTIVTPRVHPLFEIISGSVESWEKVDDSQV
jgi:Pyrimidine dimer DNA glycosylase